jgi:hypothetical protein
MSDALAIPVNVGVAKYATDAAFAEVAKAVDFLPRFQLYSSNSKECKKGKIAIAHYGYTQGDEIIDCGTEVRCFSLGMRLKAMLIAGDRVTAHFNPEHPEFKKIQAESKIKDTGALCGPEFLLWLSEKGVFVTFYMANKTMRREAPNVYQYTPHAGDPSRNIAPRGASPLTLKAQLIEKGEYSWHGPVITGCSIPLTPPPEEAFVTELTKFNNPPEPKDEAATAVDAAKTARAR